MFPLPAAPLIHTVLETLGIVIALGYYQRLRANIEDPISDAHRMSLLIAATFGAFAGSRLLGGLESPSLFWGGGGAAGWLYYLQAKTIVGGLLGGLWAVESTKYILGIKSRSGDVYVYPLLLAMIIGRVGCLAMGVDEPTFGLPTASWLGIDLGDGLHRHATALYEIIFLGIFWLVLRWLAVHRQLRSGRLFMLFLSGYLSYRFLIGFLQPRTLVGGLGMIQWACLSGLVWYLIDEWASTPDLEVS
ncbi:prolipoprotein diacylglyceryl transferase family protein [Neolewinella persica]|uniref:prolipoprotein diacylglyceryl transferase family protein n=1 Tax=Neolewinella persica TaxID=70998 RepID=UPI000374D53D|nr:prolipoprotein diacylglyceryl transferase family protein [Neolewinella persica]